MALALFNDLQDDIPETDAEVVFFGLNNTTKPTLLEPGTLSRAENVLLDSAGIVDTRPGMRIVADAFATTGAAVDGLGYYDIPTKEAVLLSAGTAVFALYGSTAPQTIANVGASAHTAGKKNFAQLVDKMFYTTATDLRWLQWSGTIWNKGIVTQFSDGSPLPPFKTLVAHKFKLYGAAADSDQLWSSKYLQASASGTGGDWVAVNGVRVGIGGGDPIMALLSGQDSNLIVLNQGSCWMIDTSDLDPANWPIRKITDRAGCVATATALNVGQDVYFLSRMGVVTLGALEQTNAISPSSMLSAPIQNTIARINWLAVDTAAKATMWKHYYLLALPIDGSTYANRVVAFNTITQKWVGEWTTQNPQFSTNPGGWGEAVMTRFGGRNDTLWADIDGGIYLLDDTYESDDGTGGARYDIETQAMARAFVFGSQVNPKQPFWLEAEFYKSTARGLSVVMVSDDEQTYPEKPLAECNEVIANETGSNNPTVPHRVPLLLNKRYVRRIPSHVRNSRAFRELAILIVSARGKLRLRELKVAAFIDTPRLT